jgi:hypothetical protein
VLPCPPLPAKPLAGGVCVKLTQVVLATWVIRSKYAFWSWLSRSFLLGSKDEHLQFLISVLLQVVEERVTIGEIVQQ